MVHTTLLVITNPSVSMIFFFPFFFPFISCSSVNLVPSSSFSSSGFAFCPLFYYLICLYTLNFLFCSVSRKKKQNRFADFHLQKQTCRLSSTAIILLSSSLLMRFVLLYSFLFASIGFGFLAGSSLRCLSHLH